MAQDKQDWKLIWPFTAVQFFQNKVPSGKPEGVCLLLSMVYSTLNRTVIDKINIVLPIQVINSSGNCLLKW